MNKCPSKHAKVFIFEYRDFRFSQLLYIENVKIFLHDLNRPFEDQIYAI